MDFELLVIRKVVYAYVRILLFFSSRLFLTLYVKCVCVCWCTWVCGVYVVPAGYIYIYIYLKILSGAFSKSAISINYFTFDLFVYRTMFVLPTKIYIHSKSRELFLCCFLLSSQHLE